MHGPEPGSRPQEHEARGAHTERRLRPRIYAASLSDYNNGILHGRWIDAGSDSKTMRRAINEMLTASPTAAQHGEPAEEWAIHDYEGFGDIRVDEYQSLAAVATWATGIERHGEAFSAWVAHAGQCDDALVEQFEARFLGEWESSDAYAQFLLDELGAQHIISEAPAWLQPYLRLDVHGFAHDLALCGDIIVCASSLGTWIFSGS